MRAELYDQLKKEHRDALRAYHAHASLDEAALSLGISVSTLNNRLKEARTILTIGSSRKAAQWASAHEKALGLPEVQVEPGDWRFSPNSFSSIDPASPPLPDVAQTAIEDDDDEDGHLGERVPQWTATPPASDPVPWPFPTPGREVNTIEWKRRLFVVLPATAVFLMLGGLVFTALVVGFQDELAHIQHLIARLN